MDDALVVRGLQHREHAVRDREGLGHFELAALLARVLVERLAVEQLHHEEHEAVAGAIVVEHLHDTGVPHRVGRVPFSQETGDEIGVRREVRVEHLDGRPASIAVGHRVHGAHSADAEERVDVPFVLEPPANLDARAPERNMSLAGHGECSPSKARAP